MTQATPTSPRQQFDSLRNQLGKQEGLPFLKILSRDSRRAGVPTLQPSLARTHLHPLDYAGDLSVPDPLR